MRSGWMGSGWVWPGWVWPGRVGQGWVGSYFPTLFRTFFRTFSDNFFLNYFFSSALFFGSFFLLTVFKSIYMFVPAHSHAPSSCLPSSWFCLCYPPPPPSCTTAVYHNDATYHNQRNLSQLVTQHVTIDANYHNSNAKCHNATAQLITKNFGFFCNMSQPDIERLIWRDILFEPGTFWKALKSHSN